MSAVSTNHEIKADFNLSGTTSPGGRAVANLEPGFSSAKVRPSELVIKKQFDIGKAVESIQKMLV